MTQPFTTALDSIEERVKNKQRLTLHQGKMLLKAYHEREELRAGLERLYRALLKDKARLEIDLDHEKEFASRIVTDWNALCNMLDRVFGFQVYSKDADTWTIEYQGKVSKGHASVAAAYEAALSDRVTT